MSMRLRKRLKSLAQTRGYTLAEALVTVMLVAVVTAAMSTGIAFASREMTRSMELSEAVVLQSTLKNVITNELSVTSEATVADGEQVDGTHALVDFFSVNYGDAEGASSFAVVDDAGNASAAANGSGQLAIVSGTKVKKLISGASYTNGLSASLDVGYCETAASASGESYFKAKLTIRNRQGATVVEDTFDALPHNRESLEVKTQSGTVLS